VSEKTRRESDSNATAKCVVRTIKKVTHAMVRTNYWLIRESAAIHLLESNFSF